MAAQLDLMSPDVMADPALAAHQLLAGDRIAYYERFAPPFYIASRFEDVTQILLTPEVFLSGHGQGPNFIPPAGIVSDPPLHTFFRRLVQDSFKPAPIAQLQARMEDVANSLLDAVQRKEQWDLHDDLAFPLPVTMICEIFGIPTEDLWQFKKWSDASVAALSSANPSAYEAEMLRMRAYLIGLLQEKRRDPKDTTLLGHIARANKDGTPLADEEAVSVVTQLFVAGNETTTSLITNFMWRFLADRNLWEDFCAGNIDMMKAINESLRFDPPLLGLFRTTAKEIELGGVTIPANTKIMTHYGAANRDPAAFDRPDVFDVHRPLQKIMSFGLGLHFCLGSELAKLEARVTLEALRKRCPDLQLVNDGQRIGPFLFWGKYKLPVSNS